MLLRMMRLRTHSVLKDPDDLSLCMLRCRKASSKSPAVNVVMYVFVCSKEIWMKLHKTTIQHCAMCVVAFNRRFTEGTAGCVLSVNCGLCLLSDTVT